MTDRKKTEAILFDLDGTLLDTAPDMVAALNRLLLEQQRDEMPYESLRPVVSHGSTGLITAAFGADLDADFMQSLTERFLDLYAEALAVDTVLFGGVSEVLDDLDSRGLPWGIVTNKPAWLTDRVLQELNIFASAGCVLCGDSLPEKKPHPAPLLHAANLLASNPENCIYVGDAQRDIQAGRAAGMVTLIANYGYISSEESPQEWQADGSLDCPTELQDWIRHASCH